MGAVIIPRYYLAVRVVGVIRIIRRVRAAAGGRGYGRLAGAAGGALLLGSVAAWLRGRGGSRSLLRGVLAGSTTRLALRVVFLVLGDSLHDLAAILEVFPEQYLVGIDEHLVVWCMQFT